MTEEELDNLIEEAFPIDLLTEEERVQAAKLAEKGGYPQAVKYIKSVREDLGLKSAKIYYDLYIKKS